MRKQPFDKTGLLYALMTKLTKQNPLELKFDACRYRMDYMKFVEYHRDQGADITVGCLPVDYERASDFGLMNIDNEGVVTVSPLAWL